MEYMGNLTRWGLIGSNAFYVRGKLELFIINGFTASDFDKCANMRHYGVISFDLDFQCFSWLNGLPTTEQETRTADIQAGALIFLSGSD